MDLFIFGTLLHVPLLAVVSGDAQVARRLTPATRPGFRVSRVAGQVFPIMHADADSTAQGVIVSGLDDVALARLDYYERAFRYDRVSMRVIDAAGRARDVTAYVPEPGRWTPAEPWDCGAWIAQAGALTTLTAQEAMDAMAYMSAQEMGENYPYMMVRAASRQRAASAARGGQMGRDDVTVTDMRRPYSGFFNIQELDMTFRRFDGTPSEPVSRAVFESVDCAVLLPYDPVRDRVLLVEQFRPGAYVRGDATPWVIEPVAGRIDVGEGPQEAARREAQEEAGVTLGALHAVSAAYPSPGTTTEYLYVYVGECDLPEGAGGVGGLASEAEDIRAHVMAWADFDAALQRGDFHQLPLVAAGHWLARNRVQLRASA